MKFYIALFASKLLVFINKLKGNRQDDRPGILAHKICDNFLEKIKKPDIVICVTGTNGKTTVSNLVSEMLIKDGRKVIYNDWGANMRAGVARCLLDGVTIFNSRKKIDVAVLETDEITSCDIFPYVKPDYIIVTNLFRDSMHRNAHPYFVYDKINDYIPEESVLILNSDDPISSMMGKNNKCIYYSIDKQEYEESEINIVNDFKICPKCQNLINYDFIRYHHIGKLSCDTCGFKNKKPNYIGRSVDLKNYKMEVEYEEEKFVFNLASDSMFNAYNTLCTVTLLNELDIPMEKIKKYLETGKIVASRYTSNIYKGIEVSTIATKGLNAVGTSRVCDYVSTIKGDLELIFVIDDTFDNQNGSEATCWIYDVDFEFLNKDNIKRIIVGGVRNKDYKLRMLLAGIKEEKIVCVDDEQDTYKELILKDTDKVLILHEVYYVTGAKKIKDNIKKMIMNDGEVFK